MYYSDKIHAFTVKLIPAFLPGRRSLVAKTWDCMWRLKMQEAFNAAASERQVIRCPACCSSTSSVQLAWKKGIEFSPAHCLPTKCFCFALAFALMKLFSFWFHPCGKEKSIAVSKHRSDDDDSTHVGWWTSGTLLVNWLGKPWCSLPLFSQAEVGSPCLWPERLLPFAALQGSSVCFLPR